MGLGFLWLVLIALLPFGLWLLIALTRDEG